MLNAMLSEYLTNKKLNNFVTHNNFFTLAP